MTDDRIDIWTKRTSGIGWLPVGLAILVFSVDMKFLHIVPGVTPGAQKSWLAFAILAAIGAFLTVVCVRAILWPRLLFRADASGIAVSTAGEHSEWNSAKGRFEKTVHYGDMRSIPWDKIRSISQGEIAVVKRRTRGHTASVSNGESRTSIGGRSVTHTRRYPALRILCDRSVALDYVTIDGFIQARIGTKREDISVEDRAYFTAEQLDEQTLSEVLVAFRLLPGPAQDVIARLERLRNA